MRLNRCSNRSMIWWPVHTTVDCTSSATRSPFPPTNPVSLPFKPDFNRDPYSQSYFAKSISLQCSTGFIVYGDFNNDVRERHSIGTLGVNLHPRGRGLGICRFQIRNEVSGRCAQRFVRGRSLPEHS